MIRIQVDKIIPAVNIYIVNVPGDPEIKDGVLSEVNYV